MNIVVAMASTAKLHVNVKNDTLRQRTNDLGYEYWDNDRRASYAAVTCSPAYGTGPTNSGANTYFIYGAEVKISASVSDVGVTFTSDAMARHGYSAGSEFNTVYN